MPLHQARMIIEPAPMPPAVPPPTNGAGGVDAGAAAGGVSPMAPTPGGVGGSGGGPPMGGFGLAATMNYSVSECVMCVWLWFDVREFANVKLQDSFQCHHFAV